ncbi:HU family DNA-binding protein, partial [Pseudomonas chlororaphis]
ALRPSTRLPGRVAVAKPPAGRPVKIKASNTVAFKPGKSLKDSVNP